LFPLPLTPLPSLTLLSEIEYFFELWNLLPSSYHFRFLKDISKSVLQKLAKAPNFYPFLGIMERMQYVFEV
jgi:hypothetical protein